MFKLLDIIERYQGLKYIIGINDCNVMMFEATGLDVSNVPHFKTIKEGYQVLRSLCGFQTYEEYFKSKGYKKVSPYEVSDGCILISRIHCFIYFDSKVFGVAKNKHFEFMNPTLQELNKFTIYKRS